MREHETNMKANGQSVPIRVHGDDYASSDGIC